jgi:hypothetical protein
MRHLLLLMLFMPVVLLSSGCTTLPWTGGGGTVFGSGMEITALEPELTKVYSGESVDFALRVKNTGSFDADGEALLSIGDWQCKPPDKVKFASPLIAPSEERGTGGGEAVFRWKCTAPQINEGMKVPYEARADVIYDYRSVTSNSVTLVPTQELISLRNAGKSLPTAFISASHSPVSVSIKVDGPIRMMNEENSIEFPVGIVIENTGGGVVDASKVDLKVEGIGGLTGKDCDYASMHLWRGTSQEITCTMTATNVDAITEGRIVATLTYGYTISKTVAIEVAGTRAAFS